LAYRIVAHPGPCILPPGAVRFLGADCDLAKAFDIRWWQQYACGILARKCLPVLGIVDSLFAAGSPAQDVANLAWQLQNPFSSLTRAELENRWDFRMGQLDPGTRYTLDFCPILPISLGPNWNLIARINVPFIS
jgi:hypothetical protein